MNVTKYSEKATPKSCNTTTTMFNGAGNRGLGKSEMNPFPFQKETHFTGMKIGRFRPAHSPIFCGRAGVGENRGSNSRPIMAADSWKCLKQAGFLWAMAKNGSMYPALFWPKTDVPENNSGRECCWPYLIDQHPLSPVFGQKRLGTPGNSYFAQLPPVFGHYMFRFWPFYVPFRWLLDCSNRSTWATRNTSLCDLPLLFVYFQVNNGVLYFLDYVEDIYINHGSSLFSFQCSDIVFTAYVTVYYYYVPCFILFCFFSLFFLMSLYGD